MWLWVLIAVVGFVQCLLAALVLVPWAREAAPRLGLVDAPTMARKIHTKPIPRSGGLGIFPAFWGMVLANMAVAVALLPNLGFLPEPLRVLAGNVPSKLLPLAGTFAGCATIFLLGVLDDRFNLSPKVRLAVQVAATVPVIASGVVVQAFLPAAAAAVLTALWLVFLTNSFNFLDNMNGLTSGTTVLIALVLALQSLLSREWYLLLLFAMLAGAVLGFWFYNFPKASVFLGDCGSTHLGFLIGCLTILCTYYEEGVASRLPVLIPLVVLGIPLFDTASVMWIRWRSGKPLMEGDTNHISHRLVALGMGRAEAVLFLYAATLVLGLAALPLRQLSATYGVIQVVVIGLILLLLHWLERISYRRRVADAANPSGGSR